MTEQLSIVGYWEGLQINKGMEKQGQEKGSKQQEQQKSNKFKINK